MAYRKLSSGGDSFDFDYDDISKNLKQFGTKIKEYKKSDSSNKKAINVQISKIQGHLKEIFKRPRATKDKSNLETLEKQFKELISEYEKCFSSSSDSTYDDKPEEDLQELGIEEKESLAYNDSIQLKKEEISERKEKIENLHKDFIVINEMFKDTAMMVKEQGEMLENADKNVDVAIKETGKGVDELVLADGYQRSAKKKLGCICIIAFIVVGVLCAILFGAKLI
jgi:t-SNARE complex subunit (syntaxin)